MDGDYHLFVLAELLMNQNLTVAYTEQTKTLFQEYLGSICEYVYAFIKLLVNLLHCINVIQSEVS